MLQKLLSNIKNNQPLIQKYARLTGKILLGLTVVVLIGGAYAFYKREAILKTIIAKAINKAKTDYQIDLAIENGRFTGLKTVSFDRISAVPELRDSLLNIHNLAVSVKLLPLIFGDIKLSEVKMDGGFIHFIKRDSLRNYDFLFKKKKSEGDKKALDLAELANKLLNTVFYKIPEDLNIKHFELKWQEDTLGVGFNLSPAIIDGGEVKSVIKVNDGESVWHVDGEVDPGDRQLNLQLTAQGKKVELPFLEQRLGLKLNFDTLSTRMDDVSYFAGKLRISGFWSVKNLLINHLKIAANNIIVPDGSLDADMVIGENYVELAESSLIHLQKIEANPYIRFTLKPHKIYELKLHTEEQNAQDIFNSFPKGLFESLEGIQVAGQLQYDLNFYLDELQPDSVKFSSRLNPQGFKIIKYGKTNLSKINADFIYTPYEYGKPMRNILIGPSNPNFTPINEISPYLKNALLTAEDPSFFSHHGFVEEAIRKSIATNFKKKAFKRGASTISMQLVKNVYLNRQKNLARKIEEILMVWLIENNRLSAKSRMFEVYLNLIEWGRNVYGIGEASRYYFDKHPSELNLGESIFLASIVPRPKSSLYFFEYQGNLRGSMIGYFNNIGGLMARRGFAAADSSGYGFYGVRLKESLRALIAPPDSLLIDSLVENDESTLGNEWMNQLLNKRKADSAALHQPKKIKF
ncbi:MAG: transglycosylase domain-containing protein [Sphingobacteriaceae bacterium]